MAKIAVDFDGTIVEDRYPKIGDEIPFATDTLRMLIEEHHQLILWTVREGTLLQEAIDWCHKRGVDFWAVNSDYPADEQGEAKYMTRKIKADYFIDDRNVGGLPDWGQIYHILHERKSYAEIVREGFGMSTQKKKHWWSR